MEVKQSVGSKETVWQTEAHLKFIIAIAVDYHSTKTGNQSSEPGGVVGAALWLRYSY